MGGEQQLAAMRDHLAANRNKRRGQNVMRTAAVTVQSAGTCTSFEISVMTKSGVGGGDSG